MSVWEQVNSPVETISGLLRDIGNSAASAGVAEALDRVGADAYGNALDWTRVFTYSRGVSRLGKSLAIVRMCGLSTNHRDPELESGGIR